MMNPILSNAQTPAMKMARGPDGAPIVRTPSTPLSHPQSPIPGNVVVKIPGSSSLPTTPLAARSPLTTQVPLDPPASSEMTAMTTEASATAASRAPPHPKGHRVRSLIELRDAIDKSEYIKFCDALPMKDVWYQPKDVEVSTGQWVSCTFTELVFAANLKVREITTKAPVEDILRMCYLADMIRCEAVGHPAPSYGGWFALKAADYIKASEDPAGGQNQSTVCKYVLRNDPNFTFALANAVNLNVFFRKVGYYSYSTGVKGEVKTKNPNMMKAKTTKGKTDYVIESRIFLIPNEWRMPEVQTTTVEAM